MKNLKYSFILLFCSLVFVSCSSDNDSSSETSNGIIATWSLEKTLSGDNEDPEGCITSYQIKFNDDRNEDNYGSYTSFDDYDCDGNFDNEYEGSYIYEDGGTSLTINYSTGYHDYFIDKLTEDELVVYDALDDYLYFKKISGDDDDEPDPNEELKADFNMLIECCPTTVSGHYFDEVQIDFENLSTGNIVAYEWSFGSTEENPSETFSLYNNHFVNTRVFELTVIDDEGNTDSIEKSVEFPILTATAIITFDGQTGIIDYNAFEFPMDPSDYPMDPPNYQSIFDPDAAEEGFIAYAVEIFPFDEFDNYSIPIPTIKIAGAVPDQEHTLTQVDDYYPKDANTFYVSFAGSSSTNPYKTFDDPSGTFSSGGVDIQGINNGLNIINSISLTGTVEDFYGDRKDFTIEINYLPHVCYYSGSPNYLYCDNQPAH